MERSMTVRVNRKKVQDGTKDDREEMEVRFELIGRRTEMAFRDR